MRTCKRQLFKLNSLKLWSIPLSSFQAIHGQTTINTDHRIMCKLLILPHRIQKTREPFQYQIKRVIVNFQKKSNQRDWVLNCWSMLRRHLQNLKTIEKYERGSHDFETSPNLTILEPSYPLVYVLFPRSAWLADGCDAVCHHEFPDVHLQLGQHPVCYGYLDQN